METTKLHLSFSKNALKLFWELDIYIALLTHFNGSTSLFSLSFLQTSKMYFIACNECSTIIFPFGQIILLNCVVFCCWRVYRWLNIFLAPQRRASVREDVGEILHQTSHKKYQWMRERITRLWPDWSQAAKHLERNKPAFKERLVKNVRWPIYECNFHMRKYAIKLVKGQFATIKDCEVNLFLPNHRQGTTDSSEAKAFTRLICK